MENRRALGWTFFSLIFLIFTGIGCAGMDGHKKFEAGLQHYQKTKNYDQAIQELNEAVRLDPKYAPAYNLLGWSYVKKSRLDLAGPQFQKAVELDSDHIAALGGLGLCAYAMGKDKEAIETSKRVFELTKKAIGSPPFKNFSPEDQKFFYDFYADSQTIIGMASQRLGKFEEAALHLENALKKPASWGDPQDIRLRLAQSLQGAKKYDLALEEYSKILSQDSKALKALSGRGWVYLQKSRSEEAEKDFLAALKVQPSHASAAAGMAEVRKVRVALTKEAWDLLAAKEYDQSMKTFKKALGENPTWSVLHDGLGWSYYWKGMIAEAEESFDQALKLDPGLTTSGTGKEWVFLWRMAPLNAAWALLNSQQYDKAIQAFQDLLKDKSARLPDKQHWRVFNGLGWAFYRIMDYGKAEDSFKQSLRQQPKNADSLKGLGFTYFASKRFDAAIQEMNQSLSLNGAQADVHTLVGWAYHQKKDHSQAIQAFEKALKIYPSWAEAFAGLGFGHHALGEKEKALSSFRSALWLLPGYMATKEFRDLLDQERTYWPLYADWGWSYFYAWMFPESEEQFALALSKFPDRPDLLRGLGYTQYRLKKYDQALARLGKSWELDPQLDPVKEYVSIQNTPGVYFIQSDAQSRMAWSHYFKKNYDQAEKFFQEVIARHPHWGNSRTGLAWCLFMKGKYDEAEKEFKGAQKADPAYPDSYNGVKAVAEVRYAPANKAWNFYYLGNFDQAIQEFKSALEAKPQLLPEKEVWALPLGIGWSLYWKKDYPGAAFEFQKVLSKIPGHFSAHQGLGYIHMRDNKFDQAITEFLKSLEANPANVDVQGNLGWAYYKKGDDDHAVKAFGAAVNLNPYLPDPFKGLAWSQWRQGQKEKAKESFAKAIAIYPGYVEDEDFGKVFKDSKEGADLYLQLGWSYYQKGLLKEGQMKFHQVLGQFPDNAEALSGLGYVFYSQKQYDQAISYFEKVLAREPSWGYVRADLAWSYYYHGNFAKAKEEFQKVVSAHPQVASYQSGLGWTLFRLKNPEEARRVFQAALKLNPQDPSALEGLRNMGRK